MSPDGAEVGSTTNSYEILAKLATGGMAEIFLARASAAGVDRYVVLKRVLHHRAQDINFIQMFLDEARLAAQLQHANIAQVHDIGKLGDSFFFTMEYVHGETVSALVRRANKLERPIPISVVLTLVAGVAAGLHHAHERIGIDGEALGIVHRDVSPSNLMISYEGTVKVVDFGVAKATLRVADTNSGTVKGKISYLSPEQCRGKKIDRRSDLFSLGIVMWELLTGERLFKKATDYEHMEAIVLGETEAPSVRRKDVPPALDAVVVKLLEKDPDDRFQTAEEFLEAIEGVAVHTGSALSTAALARFIRELFGRRPEPWVEIRQEMHSDGVTVTTEPIPQEIVVPIADTLSRDLAKLPDFSDAQVHASGSQPRVSSENGIRTSQPPAKPRASSKATADVPATKSFTYSALPPVDADTDAELPRRRRRPIAMLVVVGALVAGAAIVVFAVRGGDSEAKRPGPPGSAAIAAVADAAPVAIDAAAVATAPADAPAADAAPPVHAPRTPAELVVELTKAYEAQDYAAVFAGCGNPAVLPRAIAPCTVAACKLHDAGKAQRWFAKLSGRQRDPVVAACDGTGVVLVHREVAAPPHHEVTPPHHEVTPPHHDPAPPDAGVAPTTGACKPDPNDPLACQH